jgi:hypothetical protein
MNRRELLRLLTGLPFVGRLLPAFKKRTVCEGGDPCPACLSAELRSIRVPFTPTCRRIPADMDLDWNIQMRAAGVFHVTDEQWEQMVKTMVRDPRREAS